MNGIQFVIASLINTSDFVLTQNGWTQPKNINAYTLNFEFYNDAECTEKVPASDVSGTLSVNIQCSINGIIQQIPAGQNMNMTEAQQLWWTVGIPYLLQFVISETITGCNYIKIIFETS
jgi:hypothetical protein